MEFVLVGTDPFEPIEMHIEFDQWSETAESRDQAAFIEEATDPMMRISLSRGGRVVASFTTDQLLSASPIIGDDLDAWVPQRLRNDSGD
jgi:hypothetical protein